MKTCPTCNMVKPMEGFYRGVSNRCKECHKSYVKACRAANIDYYREYDRNRASLPHRKENASRVIARWKQEHPDRRAANVAVGNALRDGKIVALPCWICGAKAEAHHPDYSLPLDVVWLCPAHHKQAHAQAKEVV